MVNKKRLIRLTQDLIRIDSQNPPGDERRIARFVGKKILRVRQKTHQCRRQAKKQECAFFFVAQPAPGYRSCRKRLEI